MKKAYWMIFPLIYCACISVWAWSACAQTSIEPRTAQPSVAPNASAAHVQAGNQALAAQVCDRLVKLNERARSINRSIGDYIKLDGEMNQIFLKSRSDLAQAVKGQLPEGKTIAGTINQSSSGQIGGVITKEQVIGQSPEVRRIRELEGDSLRLKDKIVGDLSLLRQEMSSVASDLAKLSGGGLVPAESKHCIKRASSRLDGEIAGLNERIHALRAQKGAQNLNTRLSICGSCDENQCVSCCRNVYKISADEGSALRAQQERQRLKCVGNCMVIYSLCQKDSNEADMWAKMLDIMKDVTEKQANNSGKISKI